MGTTSAKVRVSHGETVGTGTTCLTGAARESLRTAWTTCGPAWRIAAVGVAALATLATTSDAVPAASGVATAILVGAALVDVREHRLPNAIIAAAALSFFVLLVFEAALGAPIQPAQIAWGSLTMGAPLLALHVVSPASMGFGDVKLAIVLGAAVGAVDWQLAISALALAAGITASVGVVRGSRTIALGPGLVFGAAIALASHPVLLPTAEPPPGISIAASANPLDGAQQDEPTGGHSRSATATGRGIE